MENLKNKTIGVIFGGQSPEHEVSIITGELVLSELKKQGYKVVPIYIARNGQWIVSNKLDKLKFFKGSNLEIKNKLKKIQNYLLDINKSAKFGKLVFKQNKKFIAKEIIIDIVLPAFHGQFGEDGTIQGLLEFLDIPYVGNNVVASAMTMDKAVSLNLCYSQNISTVNFKVLKKSLVKNIENSCEKITKKLNYPLFVKPARLGSSIGISKANNKDELKQAVEVAFSYDLKIVIEEAVNNLSDLTCAVLEKKDGDLQTSLVQESIFDGDFFNYDDKYLEDGGAQLGKNDKKLVIPAKIDKEVEKKIKKLSKKVFRAFDCSGMARVDFLYNNKSKKLYVGEINTIPGTFYHHLWKASGVSLQKVIDELLRVAMKNYKNKNRVDNKLRMEILTEANSLKLQYNDKK
ncbi:MAG TPA: D-alanine--D-alanine ligase [Candidatus Moranbacteria bacterium]|nr:D-alanine--D-alanine ligase [Candidatus Moranbacteria bacterium]